jgi:excinuclease UvrABC ATPase subunit
MSVTEAGEFFGAGEARTPAAHAILDRLVDSGKSVIVIEHNQALMAHADWIIDLGPGAGHDGGRIVFEGTPADLVAASSTLTGEHLAADVSTARG